MSAPRLALLGCGNWGRNLLRDLVAAGAEPLVIEPEPARRAWAGDHGAADALASLSEVRGDLDGAVIATPSATHVQTTMQVLERARFAYVEKPLAERTGPARALVAAHGERVFCLEKWRYHPAVDALAGLIAGGALGELRSIDTWRLSGALLTPEAHPLWTLLPHDLSMVRHLIGPLPPVRSAHPEFAAGRMVGVVAELGGAPRIRIEVSVARETFLRKLEVRGEKARATFDLGQPDTIRIWRSGCPHAESLDVDSALPTRLQMAAVVAHLAGGEPPCSSAYEGLETVERIDQILTCAREGRP